MSDWWLVDSALRVPYGGQSSTLYPGPSAAVGGTDPAGKTYISSDGRGSIYGDGKIYQVKYSCDAVGPALGWQFKIFRNQPLGATWTFVGESQLFTPPGTGTRTLTLDTPIEVKMGDFIGVWLAGHASADAKCDAYALANLVTDGNISDDFDFVTTGVTNMNIEPLGMPPAFDWIGDSWAEGRHTLTTTNWWNGAFRNNAAANSGSRITDFMWNVSQALNPDTFTYQQHALGGQTWDFIRATAMPYVVRAKSPRLMFISGGNDVQAGTTVAGIMEDVVATLAQVTWTADIWILEVAPGNAYDDTEAALIRDLNAELATFCTTNGHHLIQIHDVLGAVRVSTGELDNMKPEYNDGSGAHTTLAGVALVSGIIEDALTAYYAAEVGGGGRNFIGLGIRIGL